ncbi:MAG: hypothetical protein R2881_07570 [Eubacteriales bacterium]
MQRNNMATVLNGLFGGNARTVYNMGTAGYTLPLIVEGFQAGIESSQTRPQLLSSSTTWLVRARN